MMRVLSVAVLLLVFAACLLPATDALWRRSFRVRIRARRIVKEVVRPIKKINKEIIKPVIKPVINVVDKVNDELIKPVLDKVKDEVLEPVVEKVLEPVADKVKEELVNMIPMAMPLLTLTNPVAGVVTNALVAPLLEKITEDMHGQELEQEEIVYEYVYVDPPEDGQAGTPVVTRPPPSYPFRLVAHVLNSTDHVCTNFAFPNDNTFDDLAVEVSEAVDVNKNIVLDEAEKTNLNKDVLAFLAQDDTYGQDIKYCVFLLTYIPQSTPSTP